MPRMALSLGAIAALMCAAPLYAHHSSGMIDRSNPIWVKGTVVRYEPINPHVFITLEERRADGQARRWIVEGPRLGRLERLSFGEDFIKAGDEIEVCAFEFKPEFKTTAPRPNDDGSIPPFVHAPVLVKPDGRKYLWGPYGNFDLCVSPDERDSVAHGSMPLPTP